MSKKRKAIVKLSGKVRSLLDFKDEKDAKDFRKGMADDLEDKTTNKMSDDIDDITGPSMLSKPSKDPNEMDDDEFKDYLEGRDITEEEYYDEIGFNPYDESGVSVSDVDTDAFFTFDPEDAGRLWETAGNAENLIEYMETKLNTPKDLRDFMKGVENEVVDYGGDLKPYEDSENERIAAVAKRRLEEMTKLKPIDRDSKREGSMVKGFTREDLTPELLSLLDKQEIRGFESKEPTNDDIEAIEESIQRFREANDRSEMFPAEDRENFRVGSLLTKGAKKGAEKGAEALDKLGDYFDSKAKQLSDTYKKALNSSNAKVRKIAQELDKKYDVEEVEQIIPAFMNQIKNKTNIDRKGNLRLKGGGFNQAAKDAADELNDSDFYFKTYAFDTVNDKDFKILKDLDNIRSGEGGKKGVRDEFVPRMLDTATQYLRVMNPKVSPSMSSDYMGTLGDQDRLKKIKSKAEGFALGTTLVGSGAALNELFSKKDIKKVSKNKSSDVTNITKGTMDEAFSLASRTPSKYVFMDDDGIPKLMYKGKEVEYSMATEEDVLLDLVPRKTKKAMGSLLSYD